MLVKDADMVVVLTHLSGGQAGQREVLDANRIRVGRAPDNDVIFSSQDLRASAHHAEIQLTGETFLIQDLKSTNGTYLNGSRIGQATLRNGHVIQCGRKGPQLLFELKPKRELAQLIEKPWTKGTTVATMPRLLAEPSSGLPRHSSRRFGRQTLQFMIETAVRQTSSSWRRLTASLAVLTLIALLSLVYFALIRPTAQGRLPAESSQVFSAIAQKNQAAVVLVQLKFQLVDQQGEVVSQRTSEGTAFAFDPRGYIATNYHIVRPWEVDRQFQELSVSPRTTSLNVIFADGKASDAKPATILRQSKELDVAILSITPFTPFPVVGGLGTDISKVHQGNEVAFIGFPYGSDLLSTTRQQRATTTFRRTTVSKVTEDLIQLDTEIQSGLSGSPIFDRDGEVIGMIVAEVQDEVEAKPLSIGLGIPIKKVLDVLARR